MISSNIPTGAPATVPAEAEPHLSAHQPIPALTGLRFVAAFSVLVSHSIGALIHFPGRAPDWYIFLSCLSSIGMPLFFVLSGFVIHYNYSNLIERRGFHEVANFFIARFARLYPLFVMCLLFDLSFKAGYVQFPANTWNVIPFYLTLTQSWLYVPFDNHSLIFQFGLMPQVSWSISTEWFFYCMYPLLFLGLRRCCQLRPILLVAAIVIGAWLLIMIGFGMFRAVIDAAAQDAFGPIAKAAPDGFFFWLLYFSPYVRISEFVLGCLSAAGFSALMGRPPSQREQRFGLFMTVAAFLLILGLLLLLYFVIVPTIRDPAAIRLENIVANFASCFGFAPFLAVLIFCCARYRNTVVNLLSSPKIVLCGEASYSLYLLHPQVVSAFGNGAAPASSSGLLFADCLLWLMAASASIGLSLVSWQCIEVPARRWLRRALMLSPSPLSLR